MHVPVLRDEVLHYLSPRRSGELHIDATVGEGGHAELFLERDASLELVGVDADPEMARLAGERLATYGSRCRVVHARFSAFFSRFGHYCARPADSVLLDLGVSMYHFRLAGRGFSFAADEALDMRLDPEQETTASELVNTLPEGELADLLYRFGEEHRSRRIAEAIVRERDHAPIERSRDLAEVVRRAVGGRRGGSGSQSRVHPATRTFQALRIAVNGELEELERGLGAALEVLAPGGRIGVISFHSLEDRAVKRILRSVATPADGEPRFRLLAKKPVVPTYEERSRNPASRSAKLRVAERLPDAADPGRAEGAA